MRDLVAVALPGGPGFVDAIRRIWDDGDAFAPLDPRLPEGERQRALDALRPTKLMKADGTLHPVDDGLPVDEGDALVIATSGTSGNPKAVVHTHQSIAASATATSTALQVDPERDRWLACLPLAHIGGLSVVLRSLKTGTPVEVHPGFDASAAIDAASRGATLTSLVTRALRQVPAESFRTVLIGGAAPPADRPSNTVATYGMTETGSGVVYGWPDGQQKQLDGIEITVAGADGNDGPNRAAGEILMRGPMLFRCYRGLPSPFDADGWFPTGDLGRWTAEGRLGVEGRRGDVIATGGEKVWPGPVEELLAARPDIAEVAVIGRPDPDWGHRVTAVIVVADGHPTPSVESLRETVRASLPAWAAPKALEVASTLPRTSLGKVQRRLL